MITARIRREIKCLKKQDQLNPGSSPATGNDQLPGEKLSVSLSVSQLAVFVRLLADVDILKEETPTSIFRKIAGLVKTEKAVSISEESLRNKFYTPQLGAVNVMKEYLLKMMNQLREY